MVYNWVVACEARVISSITKYATRHGIRLNYITLVSGNRSLSGTLTDDQVDVMNEYLTDLQSEHDLEILKSGSNMYVGSL